MKTAFLSCALAGAIPPWFIHFLPLPTGNSPVKTRRRHSRRLSTSISYRRIRVSHVRIETV
jgi:hypothetical protein